MFTPFLTDAEASRFWAGVDVGSTEICWPWLRSKNRGYGQTYIAGKVQKAHRVAYEATTGVRIPINMTIDHTCCNLDCCNALHMEVVTAGENSKRRGHRQERCKNDHPLSGENLYVHPNGRRVCIACRVEYKRDWKRRRAEAEGRTFHPRINRRTHG